MTSTMIRKAVSLLTLEIPFCPTHGDNMEDTDWKNKGNLF